MPGSLSEERAQPAVLDRITRIARGLVRTPGEIVIACGSLVEGLGNAASDIDLLVIEEPTGPGAADPARAKDAPGVPLTEATIADMLGVGKADPVDVEWVSRGYVDALVDRVHGLAPGSRTVPEFIDLEQYYRFAAGAAVVNAEAYAPTRARMSLDRLGLLLAADAGQRAAGLLAGTEAFRAAGLTDAAAYAAQQLLAWTLHVHVIEQGERFPPRKWRYEKLARLYGTRHPVYQRAWRLKAPGRAGDGAADRAFDRYVAEVLDLVHELRPAGGPDPGHAVRRREQLMAELRYAKDLEDVDGALAAGQLGMAFHALGRVSERLQDGCLLRHDLGGGDAQRKLQLLRELAAAGDELAARVLDIRLANPDDLAELRQLAARCRAAAAEIGFRLAVPPDVSALHAYFADATAVFADRAHFRALNYRASAGIGLETGLR